MHPLAQLRVPDGHVAVHWFEQSSFAVKDARGTVVQIDPYFPRIRPPDHYIHAEAPLDQARLPTDFVFLTHEHGDHTNSETVGRIRTAFPRARFVGPVESIAKIMAEAGVAAANTTTIRAGESVALGTMTAHAVYAKPPDGHAAAGIAPPDVTHLGCVLEADGVRLYFTGDPINTFAELDELVHAVAALQPTVGFMTTHPTEGEFPFYDGCARMARRIGLQVVVPAHRACLVKRDYDPQGWAAHFPDGGLTPLIIPRDSQVILP